MSMNVKEAIDRIAQLSEVKLTSLAVPIGGTIPIMAVPAGTNLHSVKKFVDEFASKPDRRVGTDTVQDLDSLIEWINRHADDGSVIFCDTTRTAPKLLSIVDYHLAVEREKEGGLSGDATARFRQFRALYEFPLSEHWKAWREVDDKEMDQIDFAEFLENRVLDLIAPDIGTTDGGDGPDVAKLPTQVQQLLDRLGGRCALPQDIITLSKGLEITANARSAQRYDAQTGEGGLVYEEQHVGEGGRKVMVPKLFLIAIPLFDRSPFHYRIPVRIRYRLKSGVIKWTFTMFGADDVIDQAIREAAEHVKQGTAATLFYGTPA